MEALDRKLSECDSSRSKTNNSNPDFHTKSVPHAQQSWDDKDFSTHGLKWNYAGLFRTPN